MRNPFRRRRRLPGAATDWDESQHIPLAGGEYVAIPEDQLPASAIERLAGVTLYRTDEGSAVFVNIDAVEAEVDERSAELSEELTERAIARFGEGDLDDPEHRAELEAAADADMESPEVQERMREITEAAFNNTDNWVKGGVDEMANDDTRYALIRVNLVTGRIEGPDMAEAAEEEDTSPRRRLFRRTRRSSDTFDERRLREMAEGTIRQDAIALVKLDDDPAEWLRGRPVFEHLDQAQKATAIRLLGRVRDELPEAPDFEPHSPEAEAYATVEVQEAEFDHPSTVESAILGMKLGALTRRAEGPEALPMPQNLVERFEGVADPVDLARRLRTVFAAYADDDPLPAFFAPGGAVWDCIMAWIGEYARLHTMSGPVATPMDVRETAVRVGYALAAMRENPTI